MVIVQSDYLAAVASSALIDLANTDRDAAHLASLRTSALLEKAAQEKADDMAKFGYFSHTSPSGVTPWHWFADVGYAYALAGENLAIDFSDSTDVNKAWMDSPAHKANIMNPGFSEIGIATAKGTYQGRATTFVVQLFGRPKQQAVKAATTTALTAATKPTVQTPKAPTAPPLRSAGVLGEETSAAPDAKLAVLATSPDRSGQILLAILATIIFFCLILVIIVEIRHRRLRQAFIGTGALAFVVSILYVFSHIFATSVLVG
jgi:hypothetical protein